MKWKCKLFGHKFKYDIKDELKRRKCVRCSLEQWGHPTYKHEGGEVRMMGYYYDGRKKDIHLHSHPKSVIGFVDEPNNPEEVNLN